MDFRLQAKLLQVVQDQQFERLGGRETVRVNVRVLAATHCDLEQAITAGRFREDLYHRLNVINIRVPSLRERTDEIVPLAEFLLAKYTTRAECAPEIPAELRRALLAYSWPGNIRELENFMRKYQVLRDPELAITELKSRAERREKNAAPAPAATAAAPPTASNGSFGSLSKVNEVQRRMEADTILTALNETHWNRKLAAARLNVDYKALLYKMKKLGIDAAENVSAHSA
jgi:two-component system response regulator AtoC